MTNKILILIILTAIFTVGCQTKSVSDDFNTLSAKQTEIKEEIQPEVTTTAEIQEEQFGEVLGVETEQPVELESPVKLDYPVSFVPQAPYAVWDELHEEACEEAAIIMVVKYFKNENLTAHTMEQGIISLAKWEEENGYEIDLTAKEAVDIIKDYFNLSAELISEVTVETIKQELQSGSLIIVPAAGRQLGNPYFQTPGPIYHMLVIRGYDDSAGEFITNDIGTKRGEAFRYKYKKLLDAIHDWNHELAKDGMTDEEIEQGGKVIISVWQ